MRICEYGPISLLAHCASPSVAFTCVSMYRPGAKSKNCTEHECSCLGNQPKTKNRYGVYIHTCVRNTSFSNCTWPRIVCALALRSAVHFYPAKWPYPSKGFAFLQSRSSRHNPSAQLIISETFPKPNISRGPRSSEIVVRAGTSWDDFCWGPVLCVRFGGVGRGLGLVLVRRLFVRFQGFLVVLM